MKMSGIHLFYINNLIILYLYYAYGIPSVYMIKMVWFRRLQSRRYQLEAVSFTREYSCFPFPVWPLYSNSFPSLLLIDTGHTSFCCPPHRTPSHTRLCNIFLFKNKYKCVFPSAPWEWLWVVWIRMRARGVQAKRKALSVMFSHPRTIPTRFVSVFFFHSSPNPNRQCTRSQHAHQSCYFLPLLIIDIHLPI